MHSALAIANEFLEIAEGENVGLSPMKLQKLVFLAHGWHLAIHKAPLVREGVEAWQWGPVISDLFHEVKEFGRESIRGRITDLGLLDPDEVDLYDAEIYRIPAYDTKTTGFLKEVWDVYREFTGIQLANWLHVKGSPWYQVWNQKGGVGLIEVISDDIIKEYYERYPQGQD
ncbi:MAG: DUF4065 domain-containing protein [Gemmatimonadota bacterium]|nr:DUF4065 domain-containing protein [Gemmatimonadota bacterium]